MICPAFKKRILSVCAVVHWAGLSVSSCVSVCARMFAFAKYEWRNAVPKIRSLFHFLAEMGLGYALVVLTNTESEDRVHIRVCTCRP